MPNDVYRWEEGGGLVHHCPVCQTPLSHDMCRTQCLGQHVEWCSRYHTQLFRKDWSSQCAPCKHSEAQHNKRHREIAELLHQLKQLQQAESQATQPATPKAAHMQSHQIASPVSKKERKAAKKAAKLASLPKVITTADIEFVAKVLHPHDHEGNEVEEERRLLEDPDIKLNLYYHKGTSNTAEVRHRHIKRKQKGDAEPEMDEEELDALLAGLKVPAVAQAKTTDERRLVDAIRKAVQDDVINVTKEQEQTQMRKAGFWRWASKKAYNRLVHNGRLWDQSTDITETPKRKDSAVAAPEDVAPHVLSMTPSCGDGGSGTPKSSPTIERNTPVSEKRQSTSRSAAKASTADDRWTKIGKTSRAPAQKFAVKLSGNGGLAKLQVRPKGIYSPLGLGFAQEE